MPILDAGRLDRPQAHRHRARSGHQSAFGDGAAIVVRPNDTLRTVFARMRASDVSQLPVIEGDRIVGLIDESDLLARC